MASFLRPRSLFLSLALSSVASVAGCDIDDDEQADTDAGAVATATQGSGGDPPMCTPNDGDGRTQCGGNTCGGGMYCANSAAGSCENGCESTLNCGPGQWCDLRMPDLAGVGLCRSTNDPACGGDESESSADASTGSDSSVSSCPDVQGNYTLELYSDSPQQCSELFDSGADCSVAQDECTLTWGCGGSLATSLLTPEQIDENGVYSVTGTTQGINYNCDVDFSSSQVALTWTCSFVIGGEAGVCEGFAGF